MKMKLIFLCGLFFLSGCSTTSYLKYEKEQELRKNEEFEQKVIIKPVEDKTPPEPPAPPSEAVDPSKTSSPNLITETIDQTLNQIKKTPNLKAPLKPAKRVTKKAKKILPKKEEKKKVVSEPLVRLPDIEDNEGFAPGSRRPLIDPFRINEKVIHSVRYFSAEAGLLTFETKPFVEVNNRKSYQFVIGLRTSSLFSKFYSVDDFVETFLDYESLVPHVFKMNARETGKLVQANSYFDHHDLKATFWEKKYTENNGEEIKNQVWDLLPFSQNAFSGLYYMRIFKWEIGKEYSFRVSDDEKNVVFKGVAEKKEVIDTDAGEFKAIKIKALILSRGALAPTGNIYFWLSDDERKIILRIVAEIKIGKLISEVVEID
jgi:hypothetical protein